MINYTPMAEMMPIIQALQQRPRPANTSPAGHAGYDIANAIQGALAGYGQMQQQERLGQLLMGAPGGMGAGTTFAGSPELGGQTNVGPPGLLGDVDPRLIEAMLLADPSGRTLTQVAMQREFAAPRVPEPPKTRDVLQGGERVFQEFDPSTGQWAEVGRGPAFAPPSQVNVNTGEGGIKVPAGYMLGPDGASVVPIPGGPAEASTGPNAAALALIPGAQAEVPMIESMLFPGGEFSPQAAGMMYIPGTAASGAATALLAGTMAILRKESGGAITDEERDNKLDTYRPKPWDSPDVARQKFERYKRDLASVRTVSERGGSPAPDAPASPEATEAPGLIEQGLGMASEALGFGGGEPTLVRDQAGYDALPPGAKYTAGDGVTRTKR